MATNGSQSVRKGYNEEVIEGIVRVGRFYHLCKLTFPCTQEPGNPQYREDYLKRILWDFAVLKFLYLTGDVDDHFVHVDALESLLAECNRIHEHQDRFANEGMKKWFFSEAYHYSEEILSAAKAMKDGDDAFSALFEENSKKRPRCSVLHGTEWSDFLRYNAVGSGLGIELSSKDAYLQVIPEPGLRLLAVWRRESARTGELLEKVSFAG
jgi:hypothetical protein